MKIYLGGCASTRHAEFMVENNANILLSFAYKSNAKKYFEVLRSKGGRANVILDSGAFTAWSKGKPVDIHDLIDWYQNVYDTTANYVTSLYMINLDIIPASCGTNPTVAEIKHSMEMSLENFKYLSEVFPDRIIPVFHQGEPESYLEELCASSDYIAISPRNDLAENYRLSWCQTHQCCSRKIHGLATTGWRNMSTVGYYSIDSAAWAIRAGMGKIFYPTKGMLKDVFVTDNSPYKAKMGRHIDNIPESEKEYLVGMIIQGGFNPDKICTDYLTRSLWNAKVFIDLNITQSLARPIKLF